MDLQLSVFIFICVSENVFAFIVKCTFVMGLFGSTVEPPVSDHQKCQVEVVAYESLDLNGSEFFLIRI